MTVVGLMLNFWSRLWTLLNVILILVPDTVHVHPLFLSVPIRRIGLTRNYYTDFWSKVPMKSSAKLKFRCPRFSQISRREITWLTRRCFAFCCRCQRWWHTRGIVANRRGTSRETREREHRQVIFVYLGQIDSHVEGKQPGRAPNVS